MTPTDPPPGHPPLPPDEQANVYQSDESPYAENKVNHVAERSCAYCGTGPVGSVLVRACTLLEAPYMVMPVPDGSVVAVDGYACLSCLTGDGETK